MDEESKKEREIQDEEEKKLIFSYDLSKPSKEVFYMNAALANPKYFDSKLLESETLNDSFQRWFSMHPEDREIFNKVHKTAEMPESLKNIATKVNPQGLNLIGCADVQEEKRMSPIIIENALHAPLPSHPEEEDDEEEEEEEKEKEELNKKEKNIFEEEKKSKLDLDLNLNLNLDIPKNNTILIPPEPEEPGSETKMDFEFEKKIMEGSKTVIQNTLEDILPQFKQTVLDQVDGKIADLQKNTETILDLLLNGPALKKKPQEEEKKCSKCNCDCKFKISSGIKQDHYEKDMHREHELEIEKFKQEGFVPLSTYDPEHASLYKKACMEARLLSASREKEYVQDGEEWIVDICNAIEGICSVTGYGDKLLKGLGNKAAKNILQKQTLRNILRRQFIVECANENLYGSSPYDMYSHLLRIVLRTCVANTMPTAVERVGNTVEKTKEYVCAIQPRKRR